MSYPGFVDFQGCEHVCEICADELGYDTDDENFAPLDNEELDSPPNCSQCGRPLTYGGLTSYGTAYVLEKVREHLKGGRAYRESGREFGPDYYKGSIRAAVVADWTEGYRYWGLNRRDRRTVDLFLEWTTL